MVVKSFSLSEDTFGKLKDYADAHSMNLSATVESLLGKALSQEEAWAGERLAETEPILEELRELKELITYTLAEHEKAREASMDEIIDRVARASSRGTKASLANLLATVTYLGAVANLTNSTHHLTQKAWETMGFEIRDQRVESDQALLLELRDLSPADFLTACWKGGGRASSSGQAMNYPELMRGLFSQSFAADELADLPEGYIDLLEEKVTSSRDEVILRRLSEINVVVDALENDETSLDSLDREHYNQLRKEREELKQEFLERHKKTIGKIRTSLVPVGDGTFKVADHE